jgi:hypothetical protein
VLLGALLLLGGCGTFGSARSGADIRELHLFGVPVAINLDQVPGPDGFAIRVYAGNGRAASGQRIDRGRLEVLLFDGGLSETDRQSATPLRTWTYDPAKLKEHAAHSSIGWGYRFAPQWGDARPTRDRITVVVRYVSPSGTVVSSAPSVISMALK